MGVLVAIALVFFPALAHAAAPQPAPAAARRDALRSVKLEALFNAAPGQPGKAEFADLNGDGVEEAVVPLEKGGSAVAVAVYGYDEVGLLRPLLLHEGHGLTFALRGGKLEIREPAQSGGKAGLTVMTYAWNGRALVLQDRRAAPNP